jgi:hypothetical protein
MERVVHLDGQEDVLMPLNCYSIPFSIQVTPLYSVLPNKYFQDR